MASSEDYVVKENRRNTFHVLAVDDSNIDRKLLERLLTLSEYHVTCVDSGDKALEYLGLLEYQTSSISSQSRLNSTHQDLVVSKVNLIMTDYSMPGITGYDLLKKIKDSSWKDVPVIVMSSENVPSRINMCLEGGAEEFLLKPVKLSDLSKLQSHILKYTIIHEYLDDDGRETRTTTSVDGDDIIDLAISKEEGKITVAAKDETLDSAISKEEERIRVTTNNDIININRDNEKEMITSITTNNETNINRDEEEESENDMNCSNATRKATLTTILMSSDLSDRRPRVHELPVA